MKGNPSNQANICIVWSNYEKCEKSKFTKYVMYVNEINKNANQWLTDEEKIEKKVLYLKTVQLNVFSMYLSVKRN